MIDSGAAAVQPSGIKSRHAGNVTSLGSSGVIAANNDVFDVVFFDLAAFFKGRKNLG